MSSVLSTGWLVTVLLPLAAVASSGGPVTSPADPDPDLYRSAGCAACHGASATGAYGPTLAATDLSFEDFLRQLREPRGAMPPFSEGFVSDDQARRLYEFVKGLEAPEAGAASGPRCFHGGRGPGPHGASGAACAASRGANRGMCGHGAGRHGSCRRGACRPGRSAEG